LQPLLPPALPLALPACCRGDTWRSFNKTEEDFETLLDYNNYLAEVEDLIYDVTNGINPEACAAKIKAYEDAHR
jgi:CDK-activating kinase assembly factor MAT1